MPILSAPFPAENSAINNGMANQRKSNINTAGRNKVGFSIASSSGFKADGSSSSTVTPTKSFACTVCGKGLARKDKLVIHMRIHTGEKPYVCEVCNKAFARRDKLVIHMNKMKHRTPTNVAPLGKRSVTTGVTLEEKTFISHENNKQVPIADKQIREVVHSPQTHPSPTVTWSCELCGRICATRDEWSSHAKSHLEEKVLSISSVHHSQPSTLVQQLQTSTDVNSNNTSTSTTVSSPPSTPTTSDNFIPQNISNTAQIQYTGDQQYCLVCRHSFNSKADLMFHIRSHFEGKYPDLDQLTRICPSVLDSSRLCT